MSDDALVTFADLAREFGVATKTVRRVLMRESHHTFVLVAHVDGRWRAVREAALQVLASWLSYANRAYATRDCAEPAVGGTEPMSVR